MEHRDESYEEVLRKRKAEEHRLIEQFRFKRACVRLAPALPTEKEVQKKIKQFLRPLIQTTKENSLAEKCAELFGQRLTFFARKEGTLYKCKVQNMAMETQFTKEKILSTVQGLRMTYETYGLLGLGKIATEESKQKFEEGDVEGVPL
ncbi:hypothetical protein GCK32_008000 [Trichostrongylus colubriformis]|uniref:Uncharacterized protein n=1 Tax=Trichostrongylus colubriformis TaxID=6319 RepID=A0AAN8FKD7_TRICO